jgi:hypothetical protein
MSLEKLKIKALLLVIIILTQQYSACWAQEIALASSTIQSPADSSSSDSDATLKGIINNTDPNTAVNQVDELTRQVLLKIVQIERFNINYSLNVAKQGRWKGWRYAAFQEVNAGMGLAGAIIGTANRGYHLHTSTHLWTQLQESACYVPMIGSIIGASAAALEFWINEYHDMEANRKGFSPHKARKYVQDRVNEINALLDKRDAYLKIESSSPALAGHVRIDTVEGKILDDLRDQAILEFERFHVNARKLLAFQQAQYFFDFAKYTINAIGFEFAYLSLHKHRRIWNYRAGVMFDIAGPIFMASPILSRVIGKGVGEMNKHFLKSLTQDIHDRSVKTLQADESALSQACQETRVAPPSATAGIDRQEIYKLQDKTFSDEISSGLKSISKAKLTATQNIGAGLFVGSLKLAQGILFTIPGYYHAYNSKTIRATRVTNFDLFAASVVSIPAGAFSMVDTFRIQVQGEINRHKLLKAGTHPKQVAARRLKELDEIERKLKQGHES